MTIEEIYKYEDISARSFNVCVDNGLIHLSTILKHYHEFKTFDNLRNCGKKSNEELISLCFKYGNFEFSQLNESAKPEKQLIKTINNFTRTKREIVNSFIEINSNNLSNRSLNAISLFLDGNLKIRNISEKILTNDRFDLKDIKNVGAKTVAELKIFINSIIEFIAKISEVENENDLIILRNRFFIEKTFSIFSIPNEILESQSIFSLVEFLISKDALFDKKENIIFQKTLKIYKNQQELSLDEVAEELNISRERARQIKKKCLEDLFNNLQFIKQIDDDLYQKYSIDENQKIIIIDEDLNDYINELNATTFTKEFNTFIIYTYISDRFDLVGNIEDVFQSKAFNSRERHNWSNFYLIGGDLTNKFDFNKFVDDIVKRFNCKIEETYSFHFKSYLNNFVKINNSSIISIVFPIAEIIINQEFDIIIDLNDNIIFKRNTLKQVPEFAIEALEKLGVPSKVEEIYNLIEEEFPEITKSQEALRGSLQRTPDIIYFGRSSTYGLKKWEIEKEGIKGGTIKDIIIDFLKEKNDPIHISRILEYLKKFRGDKDDRSVIANLKVDPENRFVIYSQNFIGLRENLKNYSKKYTKLPVQLGKTIIGKHKRGFTKAAIMIYLQNNYDLTAEESNLVINNLKYFNEN